MSGAESLEAFAADRARRRDTKKQREAFAKVRLAERGYAAQLRKVARHVGDIVKQMLPDDDASMTLLLGTLRRYSDLLRPWARAVASRMVAETARRDEVAWRRYAKAMGATLRREVETAPVGDLMRRLQEEQVELITSLPLKAGRRAQEIARESLYTGARPKEAAAEILRTGAVTESRATLIARTEAAKAAATLTRARAVHVGSTGYIWRTVLDRDVRKSHRKMEGRFVRWDQPPEVEPGKFYHAGEFPNCRCFPEVVFPEGDEDDE